MSTRRTYLNANYGVKSWLLTGDHKRIAVLYLITVSLAFLIGGSFAAAIRLELLSAAGDLFESETYNKMFTMHGVVMIFLFLIPSIPAIFGNFLVPIMVGAKDLAFPKINLLSWYLYMLGMAFALYSCIAGGIDTGWTFYTPYSSQYSNNNVFMVGMGAFIIGFSSILTGLNFIVTIHRMRAPGITWFKLPLFIWAMYGTSLVMILGTPVIAITLVLLAIERTLGVGVFDPAIGGDPILFQHLFWFYSHPAVYIMVLPAMGVVSELISTFARKPVFGYKMIAGSSLAIAVFGFLIWGHHMFVSGQSFYGGMVFSVLTYLVGIPSAIKVFNWSFTLYKGANSFETPMLYGLGFIGLFLIGGLTGLFLASMGMDVPLHDTYFVVAHFHYVMVGGSVFAYMGALHFWWPKFFGRMYPDSWGRVSAVLIFAGFNLTFGPQFILGILGMPRRYHVYPDEWQFLNVMSSAGASLLAIGFSLPATYLIWSLFAGKEASANPWGRGAVSLEWTIPSPPPTENFLTPPVIPADPPHGHAHGGAADVKGGALVS